MGTFSMLFNVVFCKYRVKKSLCTIHFHVGSIVDPMLLD